MATRILAIKNDHIASICGRGGNDSKMAAAFQSCLGLAFGSGIGNHATYTFQVDRRLADPVIIIRYARDNKEAVRIDVELNGQRLAPPTGAHHILESTGGWGDHISHWRGYVLDRGVKLKSGKNQLRIIHQLNQNWITIDAVLIAERRDIGKVQALKTADVEALVRRPRVNFNPATGEFRNSQIACGVPLGGIGAGKLELFPDGWLGNVATNNNWDHPIPFSRGSFFALHTVSGGQQATRILRLPRPFEYDNAEAIAGIKYRGTFPIAQVEFSDPALPVQVSMEAFSSLIPHNLKDSGLPLAQFRLVVTNKSNQRVKFDLALAMENLVGQGGTTVRGKTDIHWDSVAGNFVEPWAAPGLAGIRLASRQRGSGARLNVQGDYVIAADKHAGITLQPRSFNSLAAQCDLLSPQGFAGAKKLTRRSSAGVEGQSNPAAALAAAGTLEPGESQTVTFYLAWHMPHHCTRHDGKDHGHFYARTFHNAGQVASYGAAHRARLLEQTRQWQTLALDSNLPYWLKFKIINGTFPIYSNSIFTKAGKFAVIESPQEMGGALGTMDQRMAAHAFTFQMFTELDKRELELFGVCQQKDGRITHFDGNFHDAIGDPNVGYGITDWPDLSSSWTMQILKLFRWTGDRAFLDALYPKVKRAIQWMDASDADGDLIPEGGNTYDYEKAPRGMFSYNASCYLGALLAGAEMARVRKDAAFEKHCRRRFAAAQKSVLKTLWNGRFFCKANDPLAKTRNENSFIASLAGDWLVRLTGLGSIFDYAVVRANTDYLLKHHVEAFPATPPMEVTPAGKAAVDSAYVLQHEPYLGMEAIYAGFPDRGLEVLHRNYQLAWTIHPFAWSMPLNISVRNPRRMMLPNYMTNTTTWHVFNALAGATLSLPEQALYVNPQTLKGQAKLEVPLFFPDFWLWLSYHKTTRVLNLRVVKVFKPGLTITRLRKLTREGQVQETRLAKPFAIAPENELRLKL